MKKIALGKTGIVTAQNAFGALPVQRCDMETAAAILRKAYQGGMTYFDTARAYSDSEEKLGYALYDVRSKIFIATKTTGKNPEAVKRQLDESLHNLRTDVIDVYQFHCVDQCYRPGDGTGMYELMQDLKRQGIIRHIGITAHKIGIAEEIVESGLYETLQFPFSYLSGEREEKLVRSCAEKGIGFVCMKALAGGLITDAKAAFAYIAQFDNALPIWGIQRETELSEWLSFMDEPPEMTDQIRSRIEADRAELTGDFCRGCGYCMPCPKGISINTCARMSLLLRRAPSKGWLSGEWQAEMKKIETCIECRQCEKKCPYELHTPELLKKNYEDYKKVLAGEVAV